MNRHAAGTRLTALTEAWRTFLHDCPLTEPAMISLEPTLPGSAFKPVITTAPWITWVSCCYGPTPWTRAAQWWHTPGGSLHISIDGRAGTGVALQVYGGIPFAHCAGLVQLTPARPSVCRWTRSTRCSAYSTNTTPRSRRWPHDQRFDCR
jgi:hypothetical protein